MRPPLVIIIITIHTLFLFISSSGSTWVLRGSSGSTWVSLEWYTDWFLLPQHTSSACEIVFDPSRWNANVNDSHNKQNGTISHVHTVRTHHCKNKNKKTKQTKNKQNKTKQSSNNKNNNNNSLLDACFKQNH